MASFIKKLVEVRNRSKSPTKQHPHSQPPYMQNGYSCEQISLIYGSLPRPGLTHQYSRDFSPYAPSASLLPLPPSPFMTPTPVARNSSRMSAHHSNQSNESVGIHSWNTEKSDTLIEKTTKPRRLDDNSSFYLNKDLGSQMIEPPLFDQTDSLLRTRSYSPRKERHRHHEDKPNRSKSPHKRKAVSNTLDYLNSQCHLEGCSVGIVVNTTRFLICRHQVCHASEYFKNLINATPRNEDLYVAVSGLSNPSPTTQFRWFVESCIPCPALKDIDDDTLETCMRLSKRFQAGGLEVRCAKYIIENAYARQPIVALCWLNWCLKHKFEQQVIQACMPSVARLSLCSLEQHRHMMSEKVFADILAAKLRGCYEKAVHVFRTIHQMDHFSVDFDRCPRCGRTKDGLRVKVNSDPCRKQIGCDRCHTEGCELELKGGEDLQAFYQCPHGLLPLNDSTEECHCQTRSLAMHLGAAYPARRPEDFVMNGTTVRKTRSPDRKLKHKEKHN
ncbi:unnamed protein product [Auanema sp. JU1783]|nr:unnamed protein product [Auanema sp. JU1783]